MSKIRVWLRLELTGSEVSSLKTEWPDIEFHAGDHIESQTDLVNSLEVVFTDHPLSDQLLRRMPRLRWLHVPRGGAHQFLCSEILKQPIDITKSRGIHAAQLAEIGLAYIFAFAKGLPYVWEKRGQRQLPTVHNEDIAGKTLGVMGLGAIGSELARKAKALGMRVFATKRVVEAKPEYVDELGGPEYLATMLARSDFAAICLPNIARLMGTIGENELRLMKRTAYLINLTAKRAVDERFLVEALRQGWIAGAALNVLPYEVPPRESDLWDLENVLIGPRVTGGTEEERSFLLGVFKENLRRYVNGKILINLVNKEIGY